MPSYEYRSEIIRAIVYVDGKRITKTFDNKADARLWAISAENAVPDERWSPPNFRHVLEHYQALELEGRDNDQILVERLCQEDWTKLPLDELTVGQLKGYMRQRLKTIKPSTFARYWCMVRQAAHFAEYEWKWKVDASLFRMIKVKVPKPTKVKRVHNDIVQRLVATANEHSRVPYLVPVIELAVATGLRRKEIADLKWGDVDFDSLEINVVETKTGYPRTIPLTKDIEKILVKVFPETLNPRASVFNASVDGIRNAFRRVRDRAGLQTTFHSLRHEAVSSLFEMGLTPIEVARISGHRTMEMVMRYSHADTSRTRAKMEGAQS
jgi:integrase